MALSCSIGGPLPFNGWPSLLKKLILWDNRRLHTQEASGGSGSVMASKYMYQNVDSRCVPPPGVITQHFTAICFWWHASKCFKTDENRWFSRFQSRPSALAQFRSNPRGGTHHFSWIICIFSKARGSFWCQHRSWLCNTAAKTAIFDDAFSKEFQRETKFPHNFR